MLSADQVPVKTSHSTMLWPMWVVLIAGSTGSALRAVRPPNLSHHAMITRRDPIRPSARVDNCTARPWPSWPRPFGRACLRDGSDFGWPSCQQGCEPGPMLGAMDLGIADDGECAGHEQAAQIAVPLFTDTAEPVPTSARVLFGYQPDPGREVAA